MGTLTDKTATKQVIGCLMKDPLLLAHIDKYHLSLQDFDDKFSKLVFGVIYNIYSNGARSISVIDIDTYLSNNHKDAKIEFDNNNGIVYLNDCSEISDLNNFDYYYGRLKKFSALRSLQSDGFDISEFYCDDPLNRNYLKIQENFDKLAIKDIFEAVKKKLFTIEDNYGVSASAGYIEANKGLLNLKESLKITPEIGRPLQGAIFNSAVRGARKGKFYLRSAPSGCGKALPNSTLIPTPSGFKSVGEVKMGDYLFDALGKPTKVLGVFPQGEKEIWEVHFEDGRIAKCSKDHLWSYCMIGQKDRSKLNRRFKTNTLEEIKEMGLKSGNSNNILIPFNRPVEYPMKHFGIDPYILGLILGDGSQDSQSFSSNDIELVEYIANYLKCEYKKNSKFNYNYTFGGIGYNIHTEDLLSSYSKLLKLKSENKFIPTDFLFGSIEQRIELLNGLLDADGSIDAKGRISFCTVSPKLRDQVIQLVYSLGMTAHCTTDKRQTKYSTGECYNIRISGNPDIKVKLFKLSRKHERVLNWYNNNSRKELYLFNPIVSIVPTNTVEEMTCFLVDNNEHLFLMNDYIVTHNTRLMVGDACNLSIPIHYDIEAKQWIDTGADERSLVITTELDFDEVQTMILSWVSGVNEEYILNGTYSEEEENRIDRAIEILSLYDKNLLIEKIPDPSIGQIETSVRRHVLTNGVQNVFYDYIFSSPSLLNEFKNSGVREDICLFMLSTALKDLATELGIFIMSATQLSGDFKNEKGIRDQSFLRGAKSLADKIDIGAIMLPIGAEELQISSRIADELSCARPGYVIDIYKNRRSRYKGVKIWCQIDLGTCRIKDLFITDGMYNLINDMDLLTFDRLIADESNKSCLTSEEDDLPWVEEIPAQIEIKKPEKKTSIQRLEAL